MSTGQIGTRIRQRRAALGLRQAALAQIVGISASYLNLIEHNRRKIGGKLLNDISAALDVEPSALTSGAEAALLAELREAARESKLTADEIARADEFAESYNGWAQALAGTHARMRMLEAMIETLNNRLSLDSTLAASMHEILSSAAAIRSTAAILAGSPDIDSDWRLRFHGNLDKEGRRLAENTKALLGYLDTSHTSGAAISPQNELDAFFQARNFSFPELETGSNDFETLIATSEHLISEAACTMARQILKVLIADIAAVPADTLYAAHDTCGPDPVALGAATQSSVARAMRRMTMLFPDSYGLMMCDASGHVLFGKSIAGFSIPRFDACCPLWPVFRAFTVPGMALQSTVEQLGKTKNIMRIFAIAEQIGHAGYNMPPLYQGTMLITKAPPAAVPDQQIGSTCRSCSAQRCPARREPSILTKT